MSGLVKPLCLKEGDTAATISLSWGGAGELPHRYNIGKKQLQNTFGVRVVETRNALRSAEFIRQNPIARADDLMEAFSDPSIKAIISNIGGNDSILTLPYTDLGIIKSNPKIFLGFSDSTITHLACYKAGITSFYGTSLLVGFAENGGMHDYQVQDINRTLFSSDPIGQIEPNNNGWTSERLEWEVPSLQDTRRKLVKSTKWNWLQGQGKVNGRLYGGCVEVLEKLNGTDWLFSDDDWKGKILFLETSEEMMIPEIFLQVIRRYAEKGVFDKIAGLILGRPYHSRYVENYNKILLQVIGKETGNGNLPIITEMDFGHTCPTFTIPYGVLAEINCEKKEFKILESGVS